MPRAVAKSGSKCSCNIGFMVLAWIFFTIALWFLVGGFSAQFQGAAAMSTVVVWYFVGIVFGALAKMAKWKSVASCGPHSCCK